MKLNLFLNKLDNLTTENRLLKFVIVVLFLMSMVLMIMTMRALRYQKVVILPPVVDSKIVVTGTDVNEDYIRMYVRYAMGLLLNYTPRSVENNFNELLALATPGFYDPLKDRLVELRDTVRKLEMVSTFYPHTISIDKSKRTIAVSGLLRQYTDNRLIDTVEKQYAIDYKIKNGKFLISRLSE